MVRTGVTCVLVQNGVSGFCLVVMGIAAVDLGSIWTLGMHIKWGLMIPFFLITQFIAALRQATFLN